jgi:hypothetical protein
MHTKNLLASSIPLIIILSLLLNSCGTCDGIAFYFTKIFEQQEPNDLNTSFANLINKNTEILADCSVAGYTKFKPSDLDKSLQEYNIERYKVSYTCDILNFSIDIYKMENKFYTMSLEMGPCTTQNVHFNESPENTNDDWYKTKYSLEYAIIGSHLQDSGFCNKLDSKINGNKTHHCK